VKSPARELLDRPPYGVPQAEKTALLLPRLEALTRHHYERCATYRHVVDRMFGGLAARYERIEDLPFLPVSLFKTHLLSSVPESEVMKTLTSSGTTGQQPSRVVLDAETATAQSAVLVHVTRHFLGKDRLPMVILDHPGVVRDRTSFSARGAGILGMAQFGIRPFYALRDDMTLDEAGLRAYLAAHAGQRIFLFGFTWMVWSFFVRALQRLAQPVDLAGGVLVHSGGWKKLESEKVTPAEFAARLRALTGIASVVNFYGMVEQVGAVYYENPRGHLHAPLFSEVIVRDPVTLRPLPEGATGLIQTLSCLPTSYPGHSLLTEDLGVLRGVDLPGLEMKGRCFDVIGRVPKSEIRGCSDTFQPGPSTPRITVGTGVS
jgi:hypothetical protein